jgi:hypothetical protein
MFMIAQFAEWWSCGVSIGFGAKGISQRPLVSLRSPTIITFPSLKILMSYFINRATQSSLHNWPIEIREPDCRPSNMCPTFALVESSFANGTSTRLVISMFLLLATLTDGPALVCSMSVQYCSAAVSR